VDPVPYIARAYQNAGHEEFAEKVQPFILRYKKVAVIMQIPATIYKYARLFWEEVFQALEHVRLEAVYLRMKIHHRDVLDTPILTNNFGCERPYRMRRVAPKALKSKGKKFIPA